jgi:biopolymer transport protein ExbD
MASAGDNGNGGIISGINVTPLVDITLVLLIIFIVTAKIIVAPAVPVDLPKASTSEDVQLVFALTIPENGPVLVNNVVAPDDDALARMARAAVAKDAEVRVVINADGGARHKRVIHALDVLKRAGVKRVAFGAVPPDEEPTK